MSAHIDFIMTVPVILEGAAEALIMMMLELFANQVRIGTCFCYCHVIIIFSYFGKSV